MADTPKSPDDEEEWYASTYTHFLRVIKLLAEEPEVQCALGQYYNVAWELKDDTLNLSELVLSLPGGSLSEKQRISIAQLVTEVSALPNEAVNVTNTIENHRRAMRDPHWQSIRVLAMDLVRQLESETKRVDAVLWPTDNV